MRRRRKDLDLGLPKRVYVRHGAFHFVSTDGKWHRLSSVEEGTVKMLEEHLRHVSDAINAVTAADMPQRIDEFLAAHCPKLQPDTRTEYRRMFLVIARAFHEFSVAQVEPADVHRFLASFADKPTAARAYKARLSTFFSYCVFPAKLISHNPCKELKVRRPPTRDRYVSHLEFAYASNAMTRTRGGAGSRAGRLMRALFDLAYLSSQRATDIRRLKWNRVRADGIFFKPSKTDSSSGARVLIPRTPEINEVLERLQQLRINDSPLVIHQADGSGYTAAALRSAWRRAQPHAIKEYRKDCAAAGVEPDPEFLQKCTVKDLRAKALTDAKRAGYSLEQLKVMAAHSSTSTTEKYFKDRAVEVSEVTMSLPKKGSKLDSVQNNALDTDPEE